MAITSDETAMHKTTYMDPTSGVGELIWTEASEKDSYVEEILEIGMGSASRIRRTYEKADTTLNLDKRTRSIAGKVVNIERKGNGYKSGFEGGTIDANDDEFIQTQLIAARQPPLKCDEFAITPHKRVNLGEAWKIDPATILAVSDLADDIKLDTSKGTCEARLLRVYQKEGKTFGVIDLRIDCPVISSGSGEYRIDYEPGSRVTLTITQDSCIDQRSCDFSIDVSGALKGSGQTKYHSKPSKVIVDNTITHKKRIEERPR